MRVINNLTSKKTGFRIEGSPIEITQEMIDNYERDSYTIREWMEHKLREKSILELQLQDSKPLPTNA